MRRYEIAYRQANAAASSVLPVPLYRAVMVHVVAAAPGSASAASDGRANVRRRDERICMVDTYPVFNGPMTL
jgi:hypothetical protein